MAAEGKQKNVAISNAATSPKDKEDEETEDPPDGGWGWMVVFSSFMIHVILDGVTYTFGIFYTEFLKHFKKSKGTTSWVASIMVGTTFCVGPIASRLANRYGCRTVTITGALLATFGLIMSTLAPSLIHLFFTAGLCTGIGFGLMYLPAIVCVIRYFKKKRSTAMGIAVCGSGIGTFILAPVTEWLVDEFGWEGAMLILSGLVLHCCVLGALFRPLKRKPMSKKKNKSLITKDIIQINSHMDVKKRFVSNNSTNNHVSRTADAETKTQLYSELKLASNHSNCKADKVKIMKFSILPDDAQQQFNSKFQTLPMSKKTSNSDSISNNGGSIKQVSKNERFNTNMHSSTELVSKSEKFIDPSVKKSVADGILAFLCPKNIRKSFIHLVGLKLKVDVILLMFGFSNFFTNFGFNVPFIYTKDRTVSMNMVAETHASYLLSIIGIANTASRIIVGYLADKTWINRLWLYNGCLALCGFATVFSSFCDSYLLMCIYAVVFGTTAGAYVSLTSVILVDLIGLDKLTDTFGMLQVFKGLGCLIGPPITGWIYDYTGSYDPGFYVSGTMIAVSGLMLFLIPCARRAMEPKKNKQKEKMQNCSDNAPATVVSCSQTCMSTNL